VAVASILHIYPYGEVRLMIFAFPAIYLLVAVAIGDLAQRVPLLLVLLAPFAWSGIASEPYNRTYIQLGDLRQMFATVAQSRTTVYADPSFAPTLRYYHRARRPHCRCVRRQVGMVWPYASFTPHGAVMITEETCSQPPVFPSPACATHLCVTS
jgi:hypothetical protein